MKTNQRVLIERIISDALMEGHSIEVFSGEETMIRNSRDERVIMAALGTGREDQLRYCSNGKRVGFVQLVNDNDGWGVTQDFTPALAPLLTGARKVSEGIFSR